MELTIFEILEVIFYFFICTVELVEIQKFTKKAGDCRMSS